MSVNAVFKANLEYTNYLLNKKYEKDIDDTILNEYKDNLLNKESNYKAGLLKHLKTDILPKADKKTKNAIIAMLKDVQQSGELTDDDVKNAIAELTGEKTEKPTDTLQKTIKEKIGSLKNKGIHIPDRSLTKAEEKAIDILYQLVTSKDQDKQNLGLFIVKKINESEGLFTLNDVHVIMSENNPPKNRADFEKSYARQTTIKAKREWDVAKTKGKEAVKTYLKKWSKSKDFLGKIIDEALEMVRKGEMDEKDLKELKSYYEQFQTFIDKTVIPEATTLAKKGGYYDEIAADINALKELSKTIAAFVERLDTAIAEVESKKDPSGLTQDGFLAKEQIFNNSSSKPSATYKSDTSYQAAVKQQTVQDLLKEKRSEINEIETKFFTKLKENNAQWAKEIEKLETKIKDELRNIEKLLYSCCSVLSKEKVLDLTEKMLSAYKNAFKKLETYKNSRSLEKINELPAKMEELLDQELGQLLAEDKKAMTAQLDEQISLLSADQVPPKTIAGLKARRNSFVKTGNYKDFLAVMERGGRELSTADNISRYQKNEGDLRFEFAIALVKRKLVSDPQKGEEMLKALYDGIISNYNEKIAGQKTDRSAEQVLTQLKQLDKFVKEFGALGLSDKELQQKGTSLQIIKAQLLDKLAAIALGKAEKVTELFDSKNLSLDNKEKLSDKILEKIKQQLKNGNLESLKELINNPSSKAREILDNLLQSGSLGKDVMAKLGEEELISLLDLRPDKAEEILNLIPKGKLETMLDKVAKGSSKHAQIEKALGKKAEVSA